MASKPTSLGNGKKKERRFWVAFDLGLSADYSALYEWLDSVHAKECGIGVATFRTEKTRSQVMKEAQGVVSGAPRARVYLISSLKEESFSQAGVIGTLGRLCHNGCRND